MESRGGTPIYFRYFVCYLNIYTDIYIIRLLQHQKKMIHSILAKYLKTDRYDNIVFIVSDDKSDFKNAYRKLVKYHYNLSKKTETSLPIWLGSKGKKIATLRFKKSAKIQNLPENTIYKLNFNFITSQYNEQTFVSLECVECVLVKAAPIKQIMDVVIEDSDEDSDEDME